jgi:hypothetical protein
MDKIKNPIILNLFPFDVIYFYLNAPNYEPFILTKCTVAPIQVYPSLTKRTGKEPFNLIHFKFLKYKTNRYKSDFFIMIPF